MAYGPGEERGPGHLGEVQGPPPPNSRMVHPHEEEIKQRWQGSACVKKLLLKKNPQNIKRKHTRGGSWDR